MTNFKPAHKNILSYYIQTVQQIIDSQPMDNPNPPKQHNPRKVNYKLHYFSKDNYSLFLYYCEGHPVNTKQKFSIGHLKIFDDSKQYNRQIFSTDHLNYNLDWTHRFFNTLIQSFQNFEIKSRDDEDDHTLDLYVRGHIEEEGDNVILLQTELPEYFQSDIQKQFWKQFQNYNDSKNQQIAEYEQLSRQNAKVQQKKLQGVKQLCQFSQRQKKRLLGRLSAILTQKVNKLGEYEQDYNIQLLEDKFKKAREQQQQRFMSTYQQQAEFKASLFQPSQDFR